MRRNSFALFLLLTTPLFAADPAEASQHLRHPGTLDASPQDLFRGSLEELAFLADRLCAEQRHELGPLSPLERARLSKPRPPQPGPGPLGLVRRLPEEVGINNIPDTPGELVIGGGLLSHIGDGFRSWTTSVRSEGAGALRLQFANIRLPRESRVFVYSFDGEVHGPYLFGPERVEEFWANTVFADEVFVELQVPKESAAGSDLQFSVRAAGHLEPTSLATVMGVAPQALACSMDISCVSGIDSVSLRRASAATPLVQFVSGGSIFSCSGGLLNDSDPSGLIPYVLTSDACINSQTVASTVETFWDYRSSTCNGAAPALSTLPRALGATLLATGSATRFTFLRLNQNVPAGVNGRWYMGWDANDFSRSGGTVIHHVGYTESPQSYLRSTISATPTPAFCENLPQGRYIYSKVSSGGYGPGSPGAPAFYPLNGDVIMVGQHYGRCGNNLEDRCDAVQNSSIDGSLRETFPLIESWLTGTGSQPCSSGPTTLCLNSNRFKVQVTWRALNLGTSGTGQAVALTGDTGYFWFFNSSNVELVIKVLDGRGVNNRFWVFYGALSDVEYTITVTDTQSGAVKTYFNPQGQLASVADTSAFPASGTDPIRTIAQTELQPTACSSESTLRSVNSSTGTSILFINERTAAVRVYWLDYSGARIFYQTIQAGQNYLQQTFVTHPWLVTDDSGNCLGIFLPAPSQGVARIRAQSADTLRLGDRFNVQVNWRAVNLGTSGVGHPVQLTSDTGYFWFFNSSNVELVLKVLDGRGVNGRFWVFYGALSDVEYTITVTDTQTGAVKTYSNPQNRLASVADTNAFGGAAPPPAAGTGDVAFRLTWNSCADLDLYVQEPNGTIISFGDPESSTGGRLDVDSNSACDSCSANPTENIFWPVGRAPRGTYRLWVEYFPCGSGQATFTLKALRGAAGQEAASYTGALNPGGRSTTFTFTY